jgi:hypothetical protein
VVVLKQFTPGSQRELPFAVLALHLTWVGGWPQWVGISGTTVITTTPPKP